MVGGLVGWLAGWLVPDLALWDLPNNYQALHEVSGTPPVAPLVGWWVDGLVGGLIGWLVTSPWPSGTSGTCPTTIRLCSR